ncbi:MAG: hypothetical protein J6J35_02740 [Alphaproteobacteria bacterium]|nr:hypothetical protein [Alphaproteobacteria bacterium]
MERNKQKVIQFIFLWQEYNHKYSQRVPSLGDRAGALSLANCPAAQHKYAELKGSFISAFSQIPSSHPHNTPRTKLYADYNGEKDVMYDTHHNSLEDFLKVVYQIRCNFLHGGKMRENAENDEKLVGWAYDCLNQLLNGIFYFSD